MKKIFVYILSAVSFFALSGCEQDFTELQDRVDELDGRVSMMENTVKSLNGNVAALQAIAAGYTVSGVEEASGVYTVVLSNGTTLTLDQGIDGVGVAPQMSVASDGFWKCDCNDGKGPQYVLDASGARVSAVGLAGITPSFAVDAEGFWTISYDGKTFSRVKDASGKDVSARPSDSAVSSYFADVKVESDLLTLTLKNGESYCVPIAPGFLCEIVDTYASGEFAQGETRKYAVKMSGVDSYVLTSPQNWTVSLSGDELSVTAPVLTKAYVADSDSDISIMAISSKGYVALAKLVVTVEGAVETITPIANVTAGEFVSYSSVKFSVITKDVTSWKYIFQPAADPAPSALSIYSSGTVGTATELTFDSLSDGASYTLYVLPLNGDDLGNVASATAEIPVEPAATYEDNLAAWNEGKSIFICGRKYSKADYGDAVSLSATSGQLNINASLVNRDAVYFLEENGGSFAMATKDTLDHEVILISRYEAKLPVVKVSQQQFLYESSFLAKKVCFDVQGLNAKNFTLASNTTNPVPMFHLDGCRVLADLNQNFLSMGTANIVKSVRVLGSQVLSSANRYTFINFSGNKAVDKCEEFFFENDIFYASHDTTPQFSISADNTNTTVAGGPDVVVNNNTFYRTVGGYTILGIDVVKSITAKKNIIYMPTLSSANAYFFRTYTDCPAATAVIEDNIVYNTYTRNLTDFNSSSKLLIGGKANNMAVTTSNPFKTEDIDNWNLVPVDDLASYGAQK